MKQWNKPKLYSLGIENTFEGVCDCGATLYATKENQHYCHKTGDWHRNNCASLGNGHDQSAKCPDNGGHEWNGESHKSKCCCGSFAGITPPGS